MKVRFISLSDLVKKYGWDEFKKRFPNLAELMPDLKWHE